MGIYMGTPKVGLNTVNYTLYNLLIKVIGDRTSQTNQIQQDFHSICRSRQLKRDMQL
jgi:hypothetical protein